MLTGAALPEVVISCHGLRLRSGRCPWPAPGRCRDEGVERVPVEGGLGRAVGVKPLLLVRAVAPPIVAVFRLLPPVVATGLPVSVPPLPPPAEDVPD